MMTHNLGGNIPFEVERMDHRSLCDDPKATELPSKRIRATNFICDCNSLGARSIELAVGVYGAEKIVFGSDGTDFGMDWTQKAINEAQHQRRREGPDPRRQCQARHPARRRPDGRRRPVGQLYDRSVIAAAAPVPRRHAFGAGRGHSAARER